MLSILYRRDLVPLTLVNFKLANDAHTHNYKPLRLLPFTAYSEPFQIYMMDLFPKIINFRNLYLFSQINSIKNVFQDSKYTPLSSKITNANPNHWFHKQKVYCDIDVDMSAFIYIISYG